MATEPAAAPTNARDSLQRTLIEALGKGELTASSLKDVLANVPMAADQRSLIELVMSLDQPSGRTDAAEKDPREREVREPDAPASAAASHDEPDDEPSTDTRIAALKRELADLREANDTLARALGACHVCWGGDDDCPKCKGRGRAGSAAPNLELFRELVVPAVRRVRSLDRTARPASRRPREVSRQWRHSHEW